MVKIGVPKVSEFFLNTFYLNLRRARKYAPSPTLLFENSSRNRGCCGNCETRVTINLEEVV